MREYSIEMKMKSSFAGNNLLGGGFRKDANLNRGHSFHLPSKIYNPDFSHFPKFPTKIQPTSQEAPRMDGSSVGLKRFVILVYLFAFYIVFM